MAYGTWDKCPGCGNGDNLGALSRFDNETMVCSSCGTAEAMADFSGVKYIAPGWYGIHPESKPVNL